MREDAGLEGSVANRGAVGREEERGAWTVAVKGLKAAGGADPGSPTLRRKRESREGDRD